MFSLVNVEQFYGIEIEEFPARIAETAMWLMDHQMNVELSIAVDEHRPSLPLVKSAHILNDNALQTDWTKFTPQKEIDYILGNPPFIGHHLQSVEQKNEQHLIWGGHSCAGVMDYVTNWYLKAAKYIQGTKKKVAFVSTNSITMGEQVGILWGELFDKYNIKIHFAHRTFSWSSEARGKAAVHVVIIGFAAFDAGNKTIFEYEDIKGEPHETSAININQYLLDSPDIIISNRSKPVCSIPAMKYGSKPTDGGYFLFTDEEKETFLEKEPQASEVIKPFLSAKEFLNNKKRWCLWLVGISPATLRTMSEVMGRVEQVKKFRAASKAKSTRDYPYHTLFRQVTQPDSDYILVPLHTSESSATSFL